MPSTHVVQLRELHDSYLSIRLVVHQSQCKVMSKQRLAHWVTEITMAYKWAGHSVSYSDVPFRCMSSVSSLWALLRGMPLQEVCIVATWALLYFPPDPSRSPSPSTFPIGHVSWFPVAGIIHCHDIQWYLLGLFYITKSC